MVSAPEHRVVERRSRRAPIVVELVDAFSRRIGRAYDRQRPIGKVEVQIIGEVIDSAFHPYPKRPRRSRLGPSQPGLVVSAVESRPGVYGFWDHGLREDAIYRLHIKTDLYRPEPDEDVLLSSGVRRIERVLRPKGDYPFPPNTTLLGGEIVSPDGAGIPRTEVSAPGALNSEVTDKDGRFVLYFPFGQGSGPVDLSIRYPERGKLSDEEQRELTEEQWDVLDQLPTAISVSVVAGQRAFVPKTGLRGFVRTDDGLGIEDAIVRVDGAPGFARSARDGSYSLHLYFPAEHSSHPSGGWDFIAGGVTKGDIVRNLSNDATSGKVVAVGPASVTVESLDGGFSKDDGYVITSPDGEQVRRIGRVDADADEIALIRTDLDFVAMGVTPGRRVKPGNPGRLIVAVTPNTIVVSPAIDGGPEQFNVGEEYIINNAAEMTVTPDLPGRAGVLRDTAAGFSELTVKPKDQVINVTDGAKAKVVEVTPQAIVTDGLRGGMRPVSTVNTFKVGDRYIVASPGTRIRAVGLTTEADPSMLIDAEVMRVAQSAGDTPQAVQRVAVARGKTTTAPTVVLPG